MPDRGLPTDPVPPLAARDAAKWERVHPGFVLEILAEIKTTRRHNRALNWAAVILESLPWVCRIVAVVGIWQIAARGVAQDVAIPVAVACAATIAGIASARPSRTRRTGTSSQK
jgi:hypothetical protein